MASNTRGANCEVGSMVCVGGVAGASGFPLPSVVPRCDSSDLFRFASRYGGGMFSDARALRDQVRQAVQQRAPIDDAERACIEEFLERYDALAAPFDPETDPVHVTGSAIVVDPFPVSITFDSLDKTIAVLNPESRSVAALDTALLSGVVRHPDSADFERTGTIFLLGHSSYLPNVINKNFQAFNGIQKLGWGDVIRLRSGDTEYVYHVDRTYEVKASDAEVEIEAGVAKLTLATCNSFGSKDDRFVVEATLVSKTAI